GGQRDDPAAVTQPEDGDLATLQAFLDDDGRTSSTERVADQHGVDGFLCLLLVAAYDHALAQGEAICLDGDPAAQGAGIASCRLRVSEGVKGGGRDAGSQHHLLGERLADLDPTRFAAGAEHGDVCVPEGVADPCRDGCFRAEDGQADLLLPGQAGQAGRVVSLYGHVVCDGGGAAVARGDVDALGQRRAQAFPDHGVLTGAG